MMTQSQTTLLPGFPYLLPKALALGLAAFFVITFAGQRSEACSCLKPSVESSYNSSTDVATMEIGRSFVRRGYRWYVAHVQTPFKGCLQGGDRVWLKTSDSSAACGATFQRGETYLINGSRVRSAARAPVLTTTLCAYNAQVGALTSSDVDFLFSREICCGDTCACADGSAPVSCFADPCQVAPECPDGQCVANYCGGCNAEFYDDFGNAVCQPEPATGCYSDQDCGAGFECNAGEVCLPPPGCDPEVGFCPAVCYGQCVESTQSTGGCLTDDDCLETGCSGQVCADQDVITTCEYREEYACYNEPITSCGCNEGRCGWAATDALKACLDAASGPTSVETSQ